MLIEGMAALVKAAGLPSLNPSTPKIARILESIAEKDARLDADVTRSLLDLLSRTSEMIGGLNKAIDKALAHLSARRR